jgi:hypothetical protein
LRYGINIYINEFVEKNKFKNALKVYEQELFNEYLQKYNNIINEIEQKNKYINNTLKNLKNDLFLYLTKKESKEDSSNKNIQIGKYYKKWSDLKMDEKYERLESFSKFYIEKFMNEKYKNDKVSNLDSQIYKKVEELNSILRTSFDNKELSYKDLNWNVKKGIITRIKILEYDIENDKFYIKTMITDVKRKSSKKSIINKEVEKVINKDILSYIVEWLSKIKENNVNLEISDDNLTNEKSNCLEKIKIKLKVKKLNNDDKEILLSKFNEFYSVVKQNLNNY